jgi:hypothetical protein
MRSIAVILLLSILATALSVAQDSTAHAKLDSLLLYQKKLMELQKLTFEEVHYVEPLANRSVGIEFNPAYLLVATARNYVVLSGGFSLFAVDRRAELAFPLFYQDGTSDKNVPLKFFTADAIYRKFLGSHQDGFYLSLGLRYARIEGVAGIEILGIPFGTTQNEIIQSKVGAHFGIGYRYFSRSGIYWGTSLVIGRYFGDDDRDVSGVTTDDSKILFDIEILKFGIAF